MDAGVPTSLAPESAVCGRTALTNKMLFPFVTLLRKLLFVLWQQLVGAAIGA